MTFSQVFSTDKLLHAAACFVLTVIFATIFTLNPNNLVIAPIITGAFAIGKEVYDKIKGHPSFVDQLFDIGFDIIGIVCALFCLSILL